MKKLLSFMSYRYVFTKAGPGELQLVSSPQRDNTHHLLSLCKASDRKPISAGLLALTGFAAAFVSFHILFF